MPAPVLAAAMCVAEALTATATASEAVVAAAVPVVAVAAVVVAVAARRGDDDDGGGVALGDNNEPVGVLVHGGEAQMLPIAHPRSAPSSSNGDGCGDGCVPTLHPHKGGKGRGDTSRLCDLGSKAGLAHTLGLLLQLTLTVLAFSVPVFDRTVYGSLPDAIRANLGLDFNAKYNMIRLAQLAGQAGGLDLFMSATFWVFIVICPLLRPVTQLALLHVPMTRERQRALHLVSRHIAAYYAFEVMLVAVPLIHMAFGPMSAEMLNTASLPEVCIPLLELYPNPEGTCFEMKIDETIGYYFTIAAVGVYLLTGFDGSPTHKYLHKKLFPNDRPPPTCGRFY